MKYLISLLAVFSILVSPLTHATETKVMIRAKAVDAKFIGTSVGGVRVVAKDAETGEILDEGWINGGTGNTTTLIKEPIKRGQPLADNDTAGYISTLDINAPTLVKFTLIGPYGYRQSLQEASVTSWIIPGKDLLGDGLVVNMPGFIVDAWTQILQGGVVEFYTKTSLLCGCPIMEDGLWNGLDYEAKAILMQDDKLIEEIPLTFKGPFGMYTGKTTLTKSGHYKAIIYLIDQTTGNVGVDRTMFEINLD